METGYEIMRAALARNIAGLVHLSVQQQEALLDSEMAEAIAATESGKPFVEIYPPEDPDGDVAADDEEAPDPAAVRARARAKARATFLQREAIAGM